MLVALTDSLAVAVSDRRQTNVGNALPVVDQRIELEHILRRKLVRENCEFQIENVAFVFHDRRFANHFGLNNRCLFLLSHRGVERSHGFRDEFAIDRVLDVRYERQLMRPVAKLTVNGHRHGGAGQVRLPDLLAVNAKRAGRIAHTRRQQDHQADIVDLYIADAV